MKRSYQVCEIESEFSSQTKKKKCLDLSQYDTDEQLIPIKYQGEWRIAGGKYKMGDTQRKEMKSLLQHQLQKKQKQLAVVLYTPLKIVPKFWPSQFCEMPDANYEPMELE